MEDEGIVLLDGKALGNLRVVDLKQELEKRGLSKSGSKKDLVKRLKQQLEFEKLCGERKSTGDCDLKLELDADTEQNEFVQQYLAQQQKIYAEQKEVKRLIELGEIQKSGDERGSDSTKAEDASDHEAQDTSDNESQPDVFENVPESSSIQKSEKKGDIDSSELEENALKQEEIVKEAAVCEKIPSPIKDEETKIEAEEVSKSHEEKVKIEGEETKSKDSSNQIKPIENVETIDHKPEDRADDIKAESGKVNADEELNIGNTIQETGLETEVSNVTDSSDVHSKSKDADEIDRDSIVEKNTNQSPEVKETEPKTDIFTPLDSSDESALKVQDISVEPSGENVSSMQPSVSSETDKSSEKDQDLIMEPAADVPPPVPYALSENKENVMKHVSKPVCETKKGSHKNGTDSDSDSKSTASEKESSESEEALNLNGKSTSKKLVRSARQETDNQGRESKSNKSQKKDSASDKKAENESKRVDKSRSPIETSKAIQKSKSRKYSEEEIKSADSESGESSDSREHKRGRRRSRKGKRKMRHSSSDSSRSQSRDNSSIEKVEKMDDEGKSKVVSGSVSESDDASRQKKSEQDTHKHNQGRQKSKRDKRKISQSGSSDSSRSRSRDRNSSVEKMDTEDNLKVDAVSVPKSHDSNNEQKKFKPEAREGRQKLREVKRKVSRSGSSDSSRSRSRDSNSSVGKDEKMDTKDNLNVDAESVLESHDSNNERKKLKPEAREGRQKLREVKRKVSRSGSSDSSRSRSRDSSSVERGESIEPKETSKVDSGSVSKSHDNIDEQESEASEGKRSRRDSKRSERRSSQSRESGNVEEVEKIKSGDNFKADAGLDSKSQDDAIEVEKSKSETPQKKFKIKRDNVKVSEPSPASRKDSSEERTEPKRKHSDAVVAETTEKDSPEATKKIEVQPYVSTRKIRITGRKLSEKSEEEPKIKRGKWGNFTSSRKPSQAISISTNSLKNWFPDFKLLKNPDVVNEAIEDMQIVSKEENNPEHQSELIEESKNVPQNIDSNEEQVPEPVEQIDESEATNILFIQNLVRPFTLLQLKELLKETGQFVEEKFWIDKIKSKCFVTYTSVEEAIKTKTALNGTRWPSSNPKILSVEFSTEENLLFHQSGSELPKSLPPAPPTDIPESHEERSLEDLRRKEREPQDRRRERSKLQPVREWDKNKLTQESPPTRERVSKSVERSKSSDKKEKKDSKRRPNEDTPAKLLDDLFQKTKSSPCIYWLPLTEEQLAEREEASRLRKLEREKRIQQREQEAEQKAKAAQSRNRTREVENRRSSTRSRSPVSRRR